MLKDRFANKYINQIIHNNIIISQDGLFADTYLNTIFVEIK